MDFLLFWLPKTLKGPASHWEFALGGTAQSDKSEPRGAVSGLSLGNELRGNLFSSGLL